MGQTKLLHFTATLEKSHNKLWGSHVRVPKSIALKLVDPKSRRVIRTLNGSAEHQCALIPFGDGVFVLSVNKHWCDTLYLEIGSEVRVGLRKDNSKYGLPVPEELEELFRQDKEGNRLFHALTTGRQRTLLYMIGSSRTPDARAWRASIVVRHLHENNGKIHYRELYHALKHR
jgi:hypothetical protein